MASKQIRSTVLVEFASAALIFAALPLRAQPSPGALGDEHPPSRGAELYGRVCAICHGPKGEGYKADEAPSLRSPEFLSSVTDEFLARVIADGRPGTTMSAWAAGNGGPLAPQDVRAVIEFIRGWQRMPAARLDDRTPAGDPAHGSSLYHANCAACHGAAEIEGPYVHIRGSDFLAGAGNGFLRYAIAAGREGTAMAGFSGTLGTNGIEDVLTFLRESDAAKSAPALSPPEENHAKTAGSTINPDGPDPVGFSVYPAMTPAATINGQLDLGAKMMILDARAPSDYLREHISGAINVPFYDPTPHLKTLPKNVWLICYCACPHAESGQLAKQLQAAGFSKVAVLDEGLPFWKWKQFPTRAGAEP